MIEALNLISDVDEEAVLLHKHTNEFLTIQEGNIHSLSIALKITSKRLFKEIDEVLTEIKSKYHANFTKIYLNVTESLVYAFYEACPFTSIDNLPVQLLANTVVGLENYAINNMLAAITYVHNLQTQTQDLHTYSIDPFVSQKMSDYQFKQNL
jgi:RNase adaptor protein for sRNA GlmZ degradation